MNKVTNKVNFPGVDEIITLYPTSDIKMYEPKLNGNLPLEPTIMNDETLFGFKRNKKLVKLLSK